MTNRFLPFAILCVVATPALAVAPAGQGGRRTTAAQMMAAPRAGASIKQINTMALSNNAQPTSGAAESATVASASIKVDTPATTDQAPTQTPDQTAREKEKTACINNNIGVGNTFVWASRYSNVNNYATMVEDIDEPDNNTCFVKVEMKSDDSKISVADIPAKYFEFGKTITCGSWTDEKVLEKRILDAKKSARTWATVGGAVGGAALGVGAMELFGNKLIGGSVQGQKALNDNELLYSQLSVLKKNKDKDFDEIMRLLTQLKTECENWTKIGGTSADIPSACKDINYEYLLRLDSAI